MALTLAQRLKELRLKKGDSLQGLADAVEVSKAHVWELETGKSKNPSIDLLTKLAKHFGLPLAHLIGEDPEAEDQDQELVAMFRELKDLTPRDREILRSTINIMKKTKE
jgi:transcriptional regulator with XRE-family HTH domain